MTKATNWALALRPRFTSNVPTQSAPSVRPLRHLTSSPVSAAAAESTGGRAGAPGLPGRNSEVTTTAATPATIAATITGTGTRTPRSGGGADGGISTGDRGGV